MSPLAHVEDSQRRAWEILLCCTRTRMGPERGKELCALLRGDADWEYLLRMAFRHGVTPLLSLHLNAVATGRAPSAVLTQLNSYVLEHTKRNLFLTGELLKLLDLLRAHAVPAVSIKGPVLAASVYGSLSLRRFVELLHTTSHHQLLQAC